MQTEQNRRGFYYSFIEHQHLKLSGLKTEVRNADLRNGYLDKENIPEYPRPEFHTSLLKHDTRRSGLRGIREDGGFKDPYGGPLIWWSLAVGPEEMKDAEVRLLEKTFPDRMEEERPEQQDFLWKFATSPAFLETSRLGSYRFTFPLQEVLEAYRDQCCSGAQPVMRIYRTALYSQEVMHVVLVHSPDDDQEFSQFPVLGDDPNAVCVYRDGRFIWRPEAMCETHRYELISRPESCRLEAWRTSGKPQFYVWDHVAVAFHVDQNQVLMFNADQLRNNLKFCQEGEVSYGKRGESPDSFDDAKTVVKELWPGWSGPLEMEISLQRRFTVADVRLVLVGGPGSGKSSSGNTILGRNAFSGAGAAPSSERTGCRLQTGRVFSWEVAVIDTPGMSGSSDPERKKEIFRCINLASPAPHAVLLVVRRGSLTTGVEETVKQVEEMFGRNVWTRTVILLTHQDQAEPDPRDRLEVNGDEMKTLSEKVGDRIQVINNNPEHRDVQQVWDLLHEVQEMLSKHK